MNINVSEGTRSLLDTSLMTDSKIERELERASVSFAKEVLSSSMVRMRQKVHKAIWEEMGILKGSFLLNGSHDYGVYTILSEDRIALGIPEHVETLFSSEGLDTDQASALLSKECDTIVETAHALSRGTVQHLLSLREHVNTTFGTIWTEHPRLSTYLRSDILSVAGLSLPEGTEPTIQISVQNGGDMPYRLYLFVGPQTVDSVRAEDENRFLIGNYPSSTLLSEEFPSVLVNAVEEALKYRLHLSKDDISEALGLQNNIRGYDGVSLRLEHGDEPVSFNFPKTQWTLPETRLYLNASLSDVERAKTMYRFGLSYQQMSPVLRRIVRKGFTLKTREEMGGQAFDFEAHTLSTTLSQEEVEAFGEKVENLRLEVARFEQARLFSSVAVTQYGLPLEVFYRQTEEFEFEGDHYRVFHYKGTSRRLKMHVFRNGVLIPNRTYRKATRRRDLSA